MRVHIVRIVRAEMAAPFSGRSGQPRVDSTTTGHRCWSTRGYHAWTKRITGTGRRLEGERERAVSLVARDAGRMSDAQTDEAMLALVRLLARQAAREVFDQAVTESDRSVEEGRE